MTGIGISIGMNLGGGISGFTDDTVRDTVDANVAGLWTVRATIGTHVPIAVSTLAGVRDSGLRALTAAPARIAHW